MHFDPRASVRARFTITMLAVIVISWFLSAATVVVFVHQEAKAVWQELREHGGQLPPSAIDSLSQRSLVLKQWHDTEHSHTTTMIMPLPVGKGIFFARIIITLALALIAGAWLSRRFTRPLSALADGAQALHGGDFSHRIPVEGKDEFARVAASLNAMAGRISAQIAALEDDARRRQQLLADVAHELRSPVATVKTMAEAMRDGMADHPERRERALAAMVGTADRLQRLVSDLLDLARLDLHEFSLLVQPVELRGLITDCLHAHAAQAAAAGITLLPVEGDNAVVVKGDPHRLTQIFDNLIGNAIAYAGCGAEVRVSFTAGDPVTIRVADTGRGIAARHLPFVFDAFHRADAARTPEDDHSGLGLRIARGLAEAHGGTLTLSSEEGRGTIIDITLPGAPVLTEK